MRLFPVSALFMALGCSLFQTPHPNYHIYPITGLRERLASHSSIENDVVTLKPSEWGEDFWRMTSEMEIWQPNHTALINELPVVADEQDFDITNIKTAISSAIEAVLLEEHGIKDGSVITVNMGPTSSSIPHILHSAVSQMIERTDQEHPTLLIPSAQLKTKPKLEDQTIPMMLSQGYPVGVAVTRLEPDSKGNTDKSQAPPQIVINNYLDPSKVMGVETAAPTSTSDWTPYQTRQHVNLSISTLLNSPDLLDQIEYVSTYVYFYRYPGQTSAGVALYKEYWRSFLARRRGRAKDDLSTLGADLRLAFSDMRVRILDVATLVDLKDRDFGSIVRKENSKLTAGLGTPDAEKGSAEEIAPSLSYETGVTSEVTLKLLRQLDQRSTYVSSNANFLRITQRGMTSVNLAGRFNERLSVHVPEARRPLGGVIGIKSGKDGKVTYSLELATVPLYSRIDALTFSVVVVRHPYRLRRTTQDSFGLHDILATADTAFVVGVTKPARIRLWDPSRRYFKLHQRDILSGDSALTPKQYLNVDLPSAGTDPLELYVAASSITEASRMAAQLRRAVEVEVGKLAGGPWSISRVRVIAKGLELTLVDKDKKAECVLLAH